MYECDAEVKLFLLRVSISSSVKMGIKTHLTWVLSVLKKVMYKEYLALVQVHSKCSVSTNSDAFLLLIR